MNKVLKFLFLLAIVPYSLSAQGIKSAKLKNGLTVYIWEDSTKSDVFGMVSVKAGAYDDPQQYTGLAHYLEHVMFKGTNRISTLDWEKEKPLYDQIVESYDRLSEITDPEARKALSKEINRLTVEASTYSNSNEFSVLVEGMGGSELNAGTTYDYTVYHNYFPASEIEKWLELYSSRLINPVFRGFQTELENVYEEYNMNNVESRLLSSYLFETIFNGTPYARKIIGEAAHLKNPRLSELIKFYQNWYIPENMALILVGNIKAEKILPVINRKFGRLPAKPSPERQAYTSPAIKGRVEKSAKIGRYPQLILSFPSVPSGHPDEIAMEIVASLLSNSNSTGLLDKLELAGDVMHVGASNMAFAHAGNVIIEAVPYYDPNQRRFTSHKATEKLLMQKIKDLKEGKVDEWLVNSIKANMMQQFDQYLENQERKAYLLSDIFVNQKGIEDLLDYKKKVESVSIEDIKRVVKQYLGEDYLAINILEGKPDKGEKLPKPDYEPIKGNANVHSEYAQWLKSVNSEQLENHFADWSTVKTRKVNDLSTLHYVHNTENNVFTLVLKYGVGTREFPRLEMATSLMSNAGIMGQLKSEEFKEELAKYNAKANYQCTKDYLYVTLTGDDTYLAEACKLMTLQVLLPSFDEKQYDNLRGSYLQTRMIELKSGEVLKEAAREYLFYKDESSYIKRMKESEILDVSISGLTGDFQKATHYAASIHYYGTLPEDSAFQILKSNLPLIANEQKSTSPALRPVVQFNEPVIYFIADKDASQCDIWFGVNGPAYKLEDRLSFDAFNYYITGGFGSVILSEIREKNSMAYSALGYFGQPPVSGWPSSFMGYVGTQSDKVNDAVQLFMNIINDMPQWEDRANNVRAYLERTYAGNLPDPRNLSQTVEMQKIQGYTENPYIKLVNEAKSVDMKFIMDFYEKNLKGKPVAISIVGDPKGIDFDKLAKYGKVVRVSREKLFSKNDLK